MTDILPGPPQGKPDQMSPNFAAVPDHDGDYWMLGPVSHIVHTSHGLVYPNEVADALTDLPEVDLAVVYRVLGVNGPIAIAAVSKWEAGVISADDVSGALASVTPTGRPDLVHVVDQVPLTSGYRPDATELAAQGLPEVGPQTWIRAPASGKYVGLTKSVRDSL